jgi:hydroxypyruvate isomerase
VLGSLPFAQRFARAAELGFRAVEMPFPYSVEAGEYAALIDRHGLRQISIGAQTTDYRKGEPGLAVDPGRRAEFMASLEEAAAYAKRISCPAVHVFSGCRVPGLSGEAMQETYCENLARAAAFFSHEGIATFIEPINAIDFPGYFLDSLDGALRCIDTIGAADIRLIFDAYHMAMMGEDPAKAFRRAHSLVGHVQFADHPGRHEPGSGRLDFAAIVSAMRELGYRGSAGLEYIPTRPATEPLALPVALADYAALAR